MSQALHPFFQMLRDDSRYPLEAYQFVRDALTFGQDILEFGTAQPTEADDAPDSSPRSRVPATAPKRRGEPSGEAPPEKERHLTGQELCEAIRLYALEQYGYMAKVVLNSWGVHATSDFGEIVYNLIGIGMMKRSKTDLRKDFDDVYDFDTAFQQQFEITIPKD